MMIFLDKLSNCIVFDGSIIDSIYLNESVTWHIHTYIRTSKCIYVFIAHEDKIVSIFRL